MGGIPITTSLYLVLSCPTIFPSMNQCLKEKSGLPNPVPPLLFVLMEYLHTEFSGVLAQMLLLPTFSCLMLGFLPLALNSHIPLSPLMDYYFIDSLECKTPAMSFCQKLSCLTNNAFHSEVKVSGRNFCKIV